MVIMLKLVFRSCHPDSGSCLPEVRPFPLPIGHVPSRIWPTHAEGSEEFRELNTVDPRCLLGPDPRPRRRPCYSTMVRCRRPRRVFPDPWGRPFGRSSCRRRRQMRGHRQTKVLKRNQKSDDCHVDSERNTDDDDDDGNDNTVIMWQNLTGVFMTMRSHTSRHSICWARLDDLKDVLAYDDAHTILCHEEVKPYKWSGLLCTLFSGSKINLFRLEKSAWNVVKPISD